MTVESSERPNKPFMLVAERYKKIVELVNTRGSMRVSELSQLCNVTEETIRRDLDRLENEGKLRRSHGGAMKVGEEFHEVPLEERKVTRAEEKRRIAQQAVQHIKPGDRILLDASSTALFTASLLPDIEITVITNSVKVALELAAKQKVEVISTGGWLHRKSLSYIGALAERSLESYHVDKAFLSCRGVHLDRGLSDSHEQHASLKMKMMQIADQTILLVDSSKFGTQAFAQIGPLERAHMMITDRDVDEDDLFTLRQMIEEVEVV